jgi:hypothetical protein
MQQEAPTPDPSFVLRGESLECPLAGKYLLFACRIHARRETQRHATVNVLCV